jgi:branched-chain amino acid transport system permease protein
VTPHVIRMSRSSRVGTGVMTFIFVVLGFFPVYGSDRIQVTLVQVLTYLTLAIMWNLLAGYSGLVSVGQQGFIGIAAYSMFSLSELNSIDPFVSIPIAAIICAAISIPVALLVFRLRGGYFAIGTWVVAEVFRLLTLEINVLGAGNVQSLTTRNAFSGYGLEIRKNLVFWSAWMLAIGATLTTIFVLRSRLGLALQAVRDDADGARGLGVDITRVRMIIWVIVAAWTGATGALIHINSATVTNRDAFSVASWTALVVFIVIIGGVGSTIGPYLGVGVYWVITEQLKQQNTWRFVVLGALAAIISVVSPKGLAGLLQRWKPFEIFPVTRRLKFGDE